MNNIFEATQNNIWNYKQNHPELVIKDLRQFDISTNIQNIVRQSMLCRGINKWLKVRRDLIAYKKQIKHKIREYQKNQVELKQQMKNCYCTVKDILCGIIDLDDYYKYQNLQKQYLINKEVLKVYEGVRKNLKAMCMTERWQIWEGKHLDDMNTIKAGD